MSVINQMLKDLEQRETPEGDLVRPAPSVVLQSQAPSSGSTRWVIALLLVIIVAMAAGWWWTTQSVELTPAVADERGEMPVKPTETTDRVTADTNTIADAPPQVEDVPPPPRTQRAEAVSVEPPPRRRSGDMGQTADAVTEPAMVETVTDTQAQTSADAPPPVPVEVPKPEQPLEAAETPKAELAIAAVELSAEELAQLKFNQGMTENNRGKVLKARELWQQALVLQENYHEARAQLAASLYGSGDNRDALAVLHQGIQLAPRHGQYRLMAARIYYQQQQLAAGLKVLEADPRWLAGQPELLDLRASLAQQTGQHQLAIDSYLTLLELSPSNRRWLMALAISYDQLQQKTAALAAYRRAISEQPMALGPELGPASRQYVLQRIAALGG